VGAIDWNQIKLVVFDVDGTLYDQEGLRRHMLRKLLLHYGVRPWFAKELKVLQSFRRQREAHAGEAGGGIDRLQYEWTAKETGVSAARVEAIVTRWMLEIPLPLLKRYRYSGVDAFLQALKEKGISAQVYSDYPYERKLEAMELVMDGGVDSTQPEVDAFKPHPKGLQYLLALNDVKPEFCVFIGDREERDGDCARNAGVHSIIVDTKNRAFFNDLTQELRGSSKG
jgi:phosphoglycolate phosphatase/putative hydrolase of the HAD superfamily